MIVYEATAKRFKEDVDSNRIVSEIELAFRNKLGRGIPPSEVSAYSNSLPHMERVIRRAEVADDCGILIEYKIPLTNFRIDFVISGQDEGGNKNFVIVELKQWQQGVSYSIPLGLLIWPRLRLRVGLAQIWRSYIGLA